MKMPKPTKFHQKLEALVGDWSGDETIHPMPWDAGGPAKGSYKVRTDLDGFAIVQDYVQRRRGKVSYRGHGVMGFDAGSKSYLWHWSDTMGGVPREASRGEWKGNTLSFQHVGEKGHSRYTYTFRRDGTVDFSIESSQDGRSWMPFITARYAKKWTKQGRRQVRGAVGASIR
jgi:hypothetical protein